MMIIYRFKFFALIILLLTGCASKSDLEARIKRADEISINNGFTKKTIRAGDFVFTVFERIIDRNLPFAFYIEKDGYAFTKKGVSNNPTPMKQMLFKLAALDNKRNVVFIARPCQYTDFSLDAKCSTNSYWTKKRLANEVVTSINELIKGYNNSKPISLIGHSGGGALAVLVAAKNKNVQDIITIAANLDVDAFNAFHNVAGSMEGSLKPIDYIKDVNNIPQLHLAGSKDEIVPPIVINRYVELGNIYCVKMQIVREATHNDGWEDTWKQILSDLPIKCSL